MSKTELRSLKIFYDKLAKVIERNDKIETLE